jgi:hypothetical protein
MYLRLLDHKAHFAQLGVILATLWNVTYLAGSDSVKGNKNLQHAFLQMRSKASRFMY